MENAGPRTEPPVYVPTAWTLAPRTDEAIARAARACRETAALAAGKRRLALVTALCQVAAERLATRDEQSPVLLSLTARTVDAAARDVTADDLEAVLFGSACRRCAEACRTALVSLFLEGY
ncbi:MAG: hypothetical protein ACRDNI_12450 [Gaiellaceae bacterium]